jgi:dTDP-4-amino-4,6-dideoxygalactose transaminase
MRRGHLSGNGPYTKKCQDWLKDLTGCSRVLLTHSCTGALEMSAILADIKPDDEVIMPSYTFVSTANAFVLRGAKPVFVDIREDTLNIDERLVSSAITERTKAIVAVHYAGVVCEMDTMLEIARKNNVMVVEDAAQSLGSMYKGRHAGTFGTFAAVSFHETKNIICGEGGALLVNDPAYINRAEIVWEKGTNRSGFFRGETKKYTWVDIGSSFLPSDLIAAFLYAQFENAEAIMQKRVQLWNKYHAALVELEMQGRIRRPAIPNNCVHNGHIYYILLPDHARRQRLLNTLSSLQIHAVFHYIPLHSSPAGKKYGRVHGTMKNTDEYSSRLIRLPLWVDMTEDQVEEVINAIKTYA